MKPYQYYALLIVVVMVPHTSLLAASLTAIYCGILAIVSIWTSKANE